MRLCVPGSSQNTKVRSLVLLTNADWYVHAIAEHRAELADLFWIPFCEKSTLDLVSTKEGFAAVCARVGLRYTPDGRSQHLLS
jgi:predicted ATP-grasp superfamily ATP-dependent carboligase